MALLAVDAGRSEVEAKCKDGIKVFPSAVSEAIEQNNPQYIEGDLEIEVDGKKWWVGQLAEREGSELKVSNFGESKADPILKVQVIAAAIYCGVEGERIDLGILVPVEAFTKDERKKLKALLKGEHKVTYSLVKDTKKKPKTKSTIITIEEKLFITPEGAAAYWSDPQSEDTQTFDFGAKTINLVYHQCKNNEAVYINSKSMTIWYGWENVKASNGLRNVKDELLEEEEAIRLSSALVRKAIDEAKKLGWSERVKTQVFGGVAHVVHPHIKKEFTRSYIPQFPRNGNVEGLYANMEEVILNV
jgi:plasmid segregation protein ParM